MFPTANDAKHDPDKHIKHYKCHKDKLKLATSSLPTIRWKEFSRIESVSTESSTLCLKISVIKTKAKSALKWCKEDAMPNFCVSIEASKPPNCIFLKIKIRNNQWSRSVISSKLTSSGTFNYMFQNQTWTRKKHLINQDGLHTVLVSKSLFSNSVFQNIW